MFLPSLFARSAHSKGVVTWLRPNIAEARFRFQAKSRGIYGEHVTQMGEVFLRAVLISLLSGPNCCSVCPSSALHNVGTWHRRDMRRFTVIPIIKRCVFARYECLYYALLPSRSTSLNTPDDLQ